MTSNMYPHSTFENGFVQNVTSHLWHITWQLDNLHLEIHITDLYLMWQWIILDFFSKIEIYDKWIILFKDGYAILKSLFMW